MTAALEGGEGSASCLSRSLRPGKIWYALYRRLGGPQGRSGQVRKISPPPGFDPWTIQPVASGYTEYTTQPTKYSFNIFWNSPLPDDISLSLCNSCHYGILRFWCSNWSSRWLQDSSVSSRDWAGLDWMTDLQVMAWPRAFFLATTSTPAIRFIQPPFHLVLGSSLMQDKALATWNWIIFSIWEGMVPYLHFLCLRSAV